MEGVGLFTMLFMLSPWALVWFVAVSVGLIVLLEKEMSLAAVGAFVVSLGVLAMWEHRPFIWLWQNPSSVFAFVICYLICSVIWAFIKWFLFVTGKKHDFQDFKMNWLRSRNIGGNDIPQEKEAEWYKSVCDSWEWGKASGEFSVDPATGNMVAVNIPKQRPFAWDYKQQITGWMAFWPWSLLWTCLDDVARRLFRRLQRWTADLMDAISHWVWKDVTPVNPGGDKDKVVFKNEYEAREASEKIRREQREQRDGERSRASVIGGEQFRQQ